MINKILKVGDSAAVTLSKKTLETMGIFIGGKVIINVSPQKREIIITPLTDDYQTRDYSTAELDEFVRQDKLDLKTAKFIKAILGQENRA